MAVGLSDRETRRNARCATRGKRLRGKKQDRSGEAKAGTHHNAQKREKCSFAEQVG